jgi:phosphoglycerate dehydrogenase-like enzyme
LMMKEPLKIVFHGSNAANFRAGFEALLAGKCQIRDLSDGLALPAERAAFEAADVVIGVKLDATMPTPKAVLLFHAPAAGTDAIDMALLPPRTSLCNCFGHEVAIAEYVMSALLARHVPLAQADADLRQQRWTYWAGRPGALRTELSSQTLGLLGFGHIAQALLPRAAAFGMRVHVANRSPVSNLQIDRTFSLTELPAFMASCDAVVVSLPLTPDTRQLVGAAALAAMRRDAVLINVGRGPVVDEAALHAALVQYQIAGAIIDTWYRYPTADQPECAPSQFDFAALGNVLMTPHMSGWTTGTVRRRQQTLADNINRLQTGQLLRNVIRAGVDA